jgi:hypothetical protein
MSDEVLDGLKVSLEAQLTKQSVNTALSIVTAWFTFIPVGGSVLKIGAYKSAEKAMLTRNHIEGLEGEALQDYKHTKAFLLYIGAGPNSDPLYKRWENQRIQLKHFFGAKTEDDLFQMKAQWKEFKDSDKSVSIPMLLMLWEVYQCWDEMYWDKLVRLKSHIETKLGYSTNLSIDERNRLKDLRTLGFLWSIFDLVK